MIQQIKKRSISIFIIIIIVIIVVAGYLNKKIGVDESGFYYVNVEGKIINKQPVGESAECGSFNEAGIAYINEIFVPKIDKNRSTGGVFIDTNGNIIKNKVFDSNFNSISGKASFPVVMYDYGKVMILDEDLNEIGELQGDYSVEAGIGFRHFFSEGLAEVNVEGAGSGYINTNGEWIIEPKFKNADNFNANGVACAQDSNTELWGYINKKGDWIIEPKYKDVYKGSEDGSITIAINSETGMEGYIDINGNELSGEWYDYASEFSDGYALVQKGEKAAYINSNGKCITDYIYDRHGSQSGFSEGLACVKLYGEEKYGYINENGETVIEPKYNHALEFSCGLAPVVNENNENVYIDKEGNVVIDTCKDMKLYPFSKDGYAAVCKDDKYGIINTKGEFVFEPQFSNNIEGNSSIDVPIVENGYFVVYLEKGQQIKKNKIK